MKRFILLLGLVLSARPLMAQLPELALDSLNALAARASQKAELDLDPAVLSQLMASAQLENVVPVKAKRVLIRSYKFDREGSYTEDQLAPLRQQLSSQSGWARILQVKEKSELVEIYVHRDKDRSDALVLLVAQPAEVNLVYLLGELTPEQLKSLVSSRLRYLLQGASAPPPASP